MNYLGAGRKDPKQTARDAVVGLRQQLQMIEKNEEYVQKEIEEAMKKARANVVSNRALATAALERKRALERELDRLAGSRLQLEMQVNTLESANLSAEAMAAMKKASDAPKVIRNLTMDKVDATMQQVNEQMERANEIGETFSNSMYSGGIGIDEDELKAELEELEQDELNMRLSEADHAPVHLPPGTSKVEDKTRTPAAKVAAEDDEDAKLKELQAALAM